MSNKLKTNNLMFKTNNIQIKLKKKKEANTIVIFDKI